MADEKIIKLFTTDEATSEDKTRSPDFKSGEVLRTQFIPINTESVAVIGKLTSGDDAPLFSFNLFNDVNLKGRIIKVESPEEGVKLITGLIEDGEATPQGYFVLTHRSLEDNKSYFMADVEFGTRQFEVRPTEGDNYEVLEINPFAPKPCHVVKPKGHDEELTETVPFVEATARQIDTVTLLILYTAKAVAAANNSEERLREIIAMGVRKLNIALEASRTECRVISVPIYAPWWEEGNDTMTQDLSYFESSNRVRQLRQQHGGDIAVLIREPDNIVLGVANCLGSAATGRGRAYCVVDYAHISRFAVLGHEVGHCLGCDHNPADCDCCDTTYAYGHAFYGNSGRLWGTIMSYVGTRLLFFSNPEVQYDGQPTGIDGSRDNARRIRNTKATISRYY